MASISTDAVSVCKYSPVLVYVFHKVWVFLYWKPHIYMYINMTASIYIPIPSWNSCSYIYKCLPRPASMLKTFLLYLGQTITQISLLPLFVKMYTPINYMITDFLSSLHNQINILKGYIITLPKGATSCWRAAILSPNFSFLTCIFTHKLI